jgi:hypothetical protein
MTVGTLGVGVMILMAFSPSSWSNSTIDGNHTSFGTVNFLSHPPTLVLVLANLDREMDLTFGSINFCVGSLGFFRLLDPIYLGPWASKTTPATTLESLIGSFSEANLSVSIRPMESKRSLVDPLSEITKKLHFKESLHLSRQNGGLKENFDYFSNYSKEDFIDLYNDVSYVSEDEWMSGLKLHNGEPTIFSSESNHDISNCHQVYAILEETSEELGPDSNPLINLLNIKMGCKCAAEGETKATVASRGKIS